MSDTDKIFKECLIEALKKINQFVVLGLGTSASALALTLNAAGFDTQKNVTVPGVFVAIDPHAARTVLLAVCIIAGVMASLSAESANLIVRQLEKSSPELLSAVCTYPCFATYVDLPIRYIAALLPLVLSGLAVLIPALHQTPIPWYTLWGWLIFLGGPYFALAVELRNPIGNAWIRVPRDADSIKR
jgi:hypothetical protein